LSSVIIAEHISKVYRLGLINSGTLGDDLKRGYARLRGKEDPLKLVDDARSDSGIHVALQDVSFDVKHGEVLGIIGKNGAGKSTLLKILSRITSPSTGKVKLKGRVASLLEVGTGFHPELSGRENIILNGAILGMTKAEVLRKFDEIVDFSGVSKFIDTPVKRYSSGMYVRLAFAVAAHLEPEILIVDEVLAVGDSEFQKKCLGKMKDVSGKDGRTVLFVSHNMVAVKNLCSRAIFLKGGQIVQSGRVDEVVNYYLNHEFKGNFEQNWDRNTAPGNDLVKVKRFGIVPMMGAEQRNILPNTPIDVEFEFWNETDGMNLNLSMFLYNISGEVVFNVVTPMVFLQKGLHKGVCHIPGNLLNDDNFSLSMMIVKENTNSAFFLEHAISFEVVEDREASGWHGKWEGFVRPKLDFSLV